MVSNTPVTTVLKPLPGEGFSQNAALMYSTNKSVKKHMPPLQSARILDQLRERICYRNYSLRTEEAYVYLADFDIQLRAQFTAEHVVREVQDTRRKSRQLTSPIACA